jgi:nucleotide-binding universal stress UspA family protein
VPHSHSLPRSHAVFDASAAVLATSPRRELQSRSAAQRPIVVLGDGSEAGLNAARRAARLGQYFGAPVSSLSDLQAEHRPAAGVQRDARLLVTHIESGWRPSAWFLGSRAEQLLREFSIPVLVVKQPADRPYRRALVAVKLDPRVSELVAAARTLAPRAQVNVVHVLDTSHEYGLRAADVPEAVVRALRTRALGDAYRKLNDRISAAWVHESIGIAARVALGHAPRRLLEMSGAARAGLIVLGKRPRHWLADLLLDRGVARTLLAEAQSDVLLVPAT